MAEERNVNDQIHEGLIPHDIDLQRVSAHCKQNVEKRLDRLASDLATIAIRIDAHGASRADARQRRLARLEKEVTETTREAYREISKMCLSDLQRVAVVEQEESVKQLEEAVNE
jgi:thymidylate kinase